MAPVDETIEIKIVFPPCTTEFLFKIGLDQRSKFKESMVSFLVENENAALVIEAKFLNSEDPNFYEKQQFLQDFRKEMKQQNLDQDLHQKLKFGNQKAVFLKAFTIENEGKAFNFEKIDKDFDKTFKISFDWDEAKENEFGNSENKEKIEEIGVICQTHKEKVVGFCMTCQKFICKRDECGRQPGSFAFFFFLLIFSNQIHKELNTKVFEFLGSLVVKPVKGYNHPILTLKEYFFILKDEIAGNIKKNEALKPILETANEKLTKEFKDSLKNVEINNKTKKRIEKRD